jgi:ATP-dependent Clp protease ATP-binding subunit ClpA
MFENADQVDHLSQIVDISSIVSLGGHLQYNAELLFPRFDDETIFIAESSHREVLSFELRYCFDSFDDIVCAQVDERSANEQLKNRQENLKIRHRRIVDLSDKEIAEFMSTLNDELYGHDKFKDEFAALIQNYRIFNKLGEHKVLSLFLMGESGVGKTEVARAIHKSLGGKRKLAKINFGNYSSDNSLNSLIGSPRGYIGSEEGEIFIRVNQSDTGLILIDEFEKSNSTLFNYFLDVLESGKMISSIAEELDLDGFIIIFTSNIKKEDFPVAISPELRSRFDYKGLFTALYAEDKLKFVEFRVNSIIKKYNSELDIKLSDSAFREIVDSISVHKFNNMRDLNKAIKERFVDYISSLDAIYDSFIEVIDEL